MKADPHPRNADRLSRLRGYDILDTPVEAEFDEIVHLVARICEAPMSAINLIDEGRQWFKAETGLGTREMPLDDSICAHAILSDDYVEIGDTLTDPRLAGNPLCIGGPGLRFYAGALLKTSDGLPLGTLCVLDTRPRHLTDLQSETLRVLGRQVVNMFELRRALGIAERMRHEADHRIKNSLASVAALLRIQARRVDDGARVALKEAESRVSLMAELHEALGHGSDGLVALDIYLDRVAALSSAMRPDRVAVRLQIAALQVRAWMASALGIIVNESLTNALKHAFPEGRAGTVAISLTVEGRQALLEIVDDGAGPLAADTASDSAADSDAARHTRHGLGAGIIEAAVSQLSGRVENGAGADGGHRVGVTFPLD